MFQKEQLHRKFLVVDDHPLIRSALTYLLSQTYANSIIEQLEDGTTIMEKLAIIQYDLIIMDLQMPNTEAISLIEQIHSYYPAVPILIYSVNSEKIYAQRVLKAGAQGFVAKDTAVPELQKAIALVLDHRIYLSPAVSRAIAQLSFQKSNTPLDTLSPREFEIAGMLLSGHTLSKISDLLHIQHSTVGTHKAKIFRKLKVSNLIEMKEVFSLYSV